MMLNPNVRHLYVDALRPPAGYVLDGGVATTFSLDLLTLLIVPLSFVMFESDDLERDLKDPVKVLEALRRTADKFTICCQKGRIGIPKINHLLYSYLENSVVEVDGSAGVFHPKTWLLRYTAEEKPSIYRFLCLSRNLTFDQSWDTLLALEGEVGVGDNQNNQPLLSFVSSLPGVKEEYLETMHKELPFVRFLAPPEFGHEIKFWPMGIGGYGNSAPVFSAADRMLVVSPFLTDNFLLRLTRDRANTEFSLISRMETLDALEPASLAGFQQIFVLDDPAAGEPDSSQAEQTSDLHAKLFMAEQHNRVRIWTGSANATAAAFSVNVEFMTELSGRKDRMGIDSFLDPEKNPFRAMLLEYKVSEQRKPPDLERAELEGQLNAVRNQIVSAKLELHVLTGEGANEQDLKLVLRCQKGGFNFGAVDVRCWPISIKEHNAIALNDLQQVQELSFPTASIESVTKFMAFAITAQQGKFKETARFVLNLPLFGMPENRNERILYSLISDRGRFLRYLLFLLAEEKDGQVDVADLAGRIGPGGNEGGIEFPDIPLMEQMVKALFRNPEKIDSIARLVKDLYKADNVIDILPPNFEQLWEPVWEARKRMVKQE